MSHCKQILKHLNQGHTITAIEALNLFGCFRLSARIFDLKESGFDIDTEIIAVGKKKIARYKLIK